MEIKLERTKVIVLNGTGGCGKDTFVEYIQKYNQDERPSYTGWSKVHNVSTVDTVKEMATQIFGWTGTKTPADRRMLSDLKDTWSLYQNGPFIDVIQKIVGISLSTPEVNNVFFIHCREPEEIKKFKDALGEDCITTLVRRKSHKTEGNHADENVENFDYDVVIDNNKSLEDFKNAAYEYAKKHLI